MSSRAPAERIIKEDLVLEAYKVRGANVRKENMRRTVNNMVGPYLTDNGDGTVSRIATFDGAGE